MAENPGKQRSWIEYVAGAVGLLITLALLVLLVLLALLVRVVGHV